MPELNPFGGEDFFLEKDPEEMRLDELKMLLHIKRQNIKLTSERLRSDINYARTIGELLREYGLDEKIKNFISHL